MTWWCPINPSLKSPVAQHGSALIIALMVIVVMSLLAASLTQMINDASRSVAWEVLGIRADLAAVSANEQALAQLFPLNQTAVKQCSDISLSPLQGSGFAGCSATINCSQQDISQLGARFFELAASAQCGSGEVTVERSQRVHARSSL